ncbi:MAG: S41 family peptidase, partial [Muribaculaceae bacterium]|nr:S41 family peptidase [Muribaculaceae bacterium]
MKKFALTAAAAILAAIITAYAAPQKSADAALARNLTTFNAIVKELQDNYVDSIAPDRAFDAAIDALLATIDPYTEYYPAEEQDALQKMTTGEYGGIGSYLMDRDSSTDISAPMENSPAARAGIKAGDRILKVDSIDVSRKLSADVTKVLRGRPNTPVTMTLLRPYAEDSIITVSLVREMLQQPSVPYYTVVGNTGYILLTSFINKSPAEVKAALEEFKGDPRVKNIVLDLRGNGGGLVESAVDILSYFLPKGTEVVRTRGRDGAAERVYKTTRSPLFPDIPVAVLIDGATASASEILAGALQDLDRGVLVGSRSFGKGLVQTTRPLPFSGVLKVTVAKYYTPSGRLIQALDYAHRNEDGSVSRIPDSLTHEYKTLHGRTIRDGGGLVPDTVIDWGKVNRLVYNVVRDNWSFDYATRFAASHPEVAVPEQFVITDSMYADFKKSIDPARFKY